MRRALNACESCDEDLNFAIHIIKRDIEELGKSDAAATPETANIYDLIQEVAPHPLCVSSATVSLLKPLLLELLERRKAAGRGWIDVKQELPPNGQTVIVHGGIAYRLENEWITQTGRASGSVITWPVTHWQPLPAPPSGEQAEPKPTCILCHGKGWWIPRSPTEAEIKRGQELAEQYGLKAGSSEVKNGASPEIRPAWMDVVENACPTCRGSREVPNGPRSYRTCHTCLGTGRAPQPSASPVTEPGGDVKELDWKDDEAVVMAVFPDCYKNPKGSIVVMDKGRLRGGSVDWKTARGLFPEVAAFERKHRSEVPHE
jgi:hypothetical protein